MAPVLLVLVALIAAGGQAPEGEVSLQIDLSRYQVRGSAAAPVLIVEFSDFKCHACEKFNLTIMPNLTREFIEPGRAKVVFVDFPLVEEASSTNVAESPHCAGRQGKYWQMHDLLWEKVGALGDQQLARYAAELGLDAAAFTRCLDGDAFRPRIVADLKFAYGLGLSSRPTFFVGRSQPDGKYLGRYIVGSQSYIAFKSVISRMGGVAPVGPGSQPVRPGGLPGFAGSERCMECHPTQYAEWKESLHARTVHEPTAPERDLLARSLICGDHEARFVLGERHARRFLVPSETEPGRHLLLPCRYDVGPAEWINLHQTDWKSLVWERSCAACHTTGFSSDDFTSREMGVGCESCHGPAGRHGAYETRGEMIAFPPLRASEEAAICASCHLQGGRSGRTGLSFPYNYQAGGDLFSDYHFDWTQLDPNVEAAGNPIDIHQKVLIRSAVTQGRQDLRCSSCHEFHRMGHARHEKTARQEFCHLCHERSDFKVKGYSQSCDVCEF
ncbi:MAG TPA: thioredoxin domain-containing protein [Candidatus Polarisedimenticolia bacterium]|jgi:protein-disulfide isomerase